MMNLSPGVSVTVRRAVREAKFPTGCAGVRPSSRGPVPPMAAIANAIHRRLTELPMSPPKHPVCESYGQTDEPGRPHVRNGPFARLPTCDAGAVKSDSGAPRNG